MIIPIYRPEITIYERTTKNRQWAVNGWVDKQGTITNTLFYPIPDGITFTEAGFKKRVEHGEEPFFRIEAPEGSYLAHQGRVTLLDRRHQPNTLYLPDGDAHDAINALVLAKRGACGLSLVRSGPPREVATPPPRSLIQAVRSSGRSKQLSMFGD